jgi:hypothetical protein
MKGAVATNDKGKKWLGFSVNNHLFLFSPAKYNSIFYQVPAKNSNPLTYWTANTTNSSYAFFPSVGAEISVIPFNLDLGFRYNVYPSDQVYSDYDAAKPQLYVDTLMSGSSLGFYLDWSFFQLYGISLGAGFDMDLNSITLTATKKDDTGKEEEKDLFTHKSSLTVFSLRLPINYQYNMGMFHIKAGAHVLIPFYALEPTVTTTIPDTVTASDTFGYESDLALAVGHQKSSFAFDIVLGAGIDL